MYTNDLRQALENVNSDYLMLRNSNEYVQGKKISEGICAFVLFKLKGIVRHLANVSCPNKELFYNRGEEINPQYRVVVYSCVTNNYDSIVKPVYFSETTKYIYFTDGGVTDDFWDVRQIDSQEKYGDRYYKLNPFKVLPKCDFSIYIDGNIQIISDVLPLCSVAKKAKTGIAMHYHSRGTCVYDEGKLCIKLGRGDRDKITEQLNRYKMEKFPINFGLYEAPIIIVDHNNPIAERIMNNWWEEFKKSGSGRDQLSLPYCIWREGFKFDDIGCLGNDVNFNPIFRKTHIHYNR